MLNVLAGMIVYDRLHTVDWWMKAWQHAEKYNDAKLLVIHNYDGNEPPTDQKENILKWEPDYYWARKNIGMDIGAFRDVIRANNCGAWDVLFWCVDDNIPMRKDFLRAFIEPFEQDPRMGLVGNYWSKGKFWEGIIHRVPDHFRTTCFAIRREVALRLRFPPRLITKRDCYKFEWLDRSIYMTSQVQRMGYRMMPVCRDWEKPWPETSDYVWDTGSLRLNARDARCRKDFQSTYNAQFEQVPA